MASEETRSLAQCRAWHSCSGVYVFCCCNLLQGVRISLSLISLYLCVWLFLCALALSGNTPYKMFEG